MITHLITDRTQRRAAIIGQIATTKLLTTAKA